MVLTIGYSGVELIESLQRNSFVTRGMIAPRQKQ
jgi:hypothetical protein